MIILHWLSFEASLNLRLYSPLLFPSMFLLCEQRRGKIQLGGKLLLPLSEFLLQLLVFFVAENLD